LDMSWVICLLCNKKFCPTCQEEYHAGFTCKQRQEWRIENDENFSRTQDWIKTKTKNCPKCNTNIEKSTGCSHMKCTHCGHEFCWECGKDYFDGHIRLEHYLPQRQARPQPPSNSILQNLIQIQPQTPVQTQLRKVEMPTLPLYITQGPKRKTKALIENKNKRIKF